MTLKEQWDIIYDFVERNNKQDAEKEFDEAVETIKTFFARLDNLKIR